MTTKNTLKQGMMQATDDLAEGGSVLRFAFAYYTRFLAGFFAPQQ